MVRWSELRQANFYDAFHPGLDSHHDVARTGWLNIFGNANVGNARLTNTQVAGQLVYGDDESMLVQRWYARTELEDTPAMRRWSENVQVRLVIGHHPLWQLSLADLLRRRPTYVDDRYSFDPFPLRIPVRQNVAVSVDSFNAEACDGLSEQLRMTLETGYRTPQYTWIHLEGVVVRNMDLAPMLDALFKKHVTAEQRVQQWLLGMLGDDEASNAQIMAIHDGLEAGVHRR